MDFHTYCFRKQTLRQYIEFLRAEDTTIKHHRFYIKAALLAIRVGTISSMISSYLNY